MSFCDVLPPSLLSSVFFRFSVLVSRELSRSRVCAVATSAIRGLAGVVVPHLLLVVRFPPTREGSGTKNSGRRPNYRATFQVSLLSFWYAAGYCRTYLLVGCSGSFLFLTPPTSASEVLTQTNRSSGVVQWLACWAHNPKVKFHECVQNRTAEQNVDVPIPRVRWYLNWARLKFYGTTFSTVTASFTRGLRVLPRQTVKSRHFVPTAW